MKEKILFELEDEDDCEVLEDASAVYDTETGEFLGTTLFTMESLFINHMIYAYINTGYKPKYFKRNRA